MAYYSNIKDLFDAAESKIENILVNYVSPVADDIVHKHIVDDIYGAYSPVGAAGYGYERRGQLASEDNIQNYIVGDNELLVTNEAEPSPSIWNDNSGGEPDRLLYWIEYGLVPNYFNYNDYPWMHSRPAIQNAQEEINTSDKIADAIQTGIDAEI